MKSDRLFTMLWRQTLLAMGMMILSNIGAILMDGVITTRVFGAVSAAAIGLISPYAMLTALLGGLLGTGCQTICSAALGNGDADSSNRALVTACCFGTAVALVLTALMFGFARPIGRFLGASDSNAELLGETVAYLRGVSLGTVGMVLNIVLAPIVQLYGGRRQVNQSVALIFVLDGIFDLLAVLTRTGCWGIGLATSVSTCLGTLILLRFLLSAKTGIRLARGQYRRELLGQILGQGMPEAVKRFLRLSGDVLANFLVLRAATGAAMAGKTVGALAASLLSVPGLGAASALYLLSGVYVGMEDEKSLVALGKRQLRMLLLTLVLTAASVALAPQITALLLNADADTRAAAVVSARCILLQMPVYICFEMVTCYLQSIGRRKTANLLSLLGVIGFYLPLVAVMSRRWGAPGVLLATPASLLLALLLCYGRLCVSLRRPAGLRDILHLSECIRTDGIEVITHTAVRDLPEAAACSESVRRALLEKGSEPRTAFAVALFVEEICANIIVHGFPKRGLFADEKLASVFVSVENDTVTLRISDNCGLYNPAEKLKTLREQQSGPESGLGLKLVFAMAEEADYTGMLNMNHMLLRVPMHGARADGEQKLRLRMANHPG